MIKGLFSTASIEFLMLDLSGDSIARSTFFNCKFLQMAFSIEGRAVAVRHMKGTDPRTSDLNCTSFTVVHPKSFVSLVGSTSEKVKFHNHLVYHEVYHKPWV